jgi:hypothetical protein
LRKASEPARGARLAWRQGKEHLGPYVNQALFSQIASAEPALAVPDARVKALLDPARIHECASLQDSGAFPGSEWEPRMFIAALQAWLASRGGPPDPVPA